MPTVIARAIVPALACVAALGLPETRLGEVEPPNRDIARIVRRARDPKAPERPRLAESLANLGARALDPLLS